MEQPAPQTTALPQGTPIPKTPTGVEGLDVILYGGLPIGRTTLISGGPGTGKTVLAMECLYRGARDGEPGVFFSFEESVEQLRANALSMGMDLAALEESGRLRVVHAPVPHDAVHGHPLARTDQDHVADLQCIHIDTLLLRIA